MSPASPRRALAANVLLAAISALLALAALEGLARVAYARRHGKEQAEQARYNDLDPLLGWRLRPGARVVYDRTEYRVEVAINAHGLRDKEREYAAAAGAFRVLALGDSFVEAYGVALDQSVTILLERALARPACPVEVINGGTAGYSTDQEYLFYRERGSLYSPQVVVLFFYYNDVVGNVRGNSFGLPKPLLAARPGGLVVGNLPLRAAGFHPAPPQSAELLKGLAAWAWLKERLLRGAPRAYNALARLGLWTPFGGERLPEELKAYRRALSPRLKRAWRVTDLILQALAHEVRQHDGRFLVVYVPSRMEVSEADWDVTQVRFQLGRGFDRGLAVRRLQASGEAGGFPVLDLTPALRRADHGILGRPYFVYDSHWNALGHEVAAREVESALWRLGWLPPCAAGSR